jgi:carbohydrate-selective porin OprB
MYNNSTFTDYSRLAVDHTATKSGADGLYILGDYQVRQFAPASPYTAYQGMYVGGTFMYGDPKSAAFTQYYEARTYFIGPFASRPQDMLSFVYSHNKTSKYLRDVLNGASAFTNFYPVGATNSLTAAYTYHVRPGLYATGGVGYTDKPSLTQFNGEGSSLNMLLSLYWIF